MLWVAAAKNAQTPTRWYISCDILFGFIVIEKRYKVSDLNAFRHPSTPTNPQLIIRHVSVVNERHVFHQICNTNQTDSGKGDYNEKILAPKSIAAKRACTEIVDIMTYILMVIIHMTGCLWTRGFTLIRAWKNILCTPFSLTKALFFTLHIDQTKVILHFIHFKYFFSTASSSLKFIWYSLSL